MRRNAPEVIELSDDELEAIPQDKRVKIVQAQIEGGRAELSELYEKLEEHKLANSELEYKLHELHTALTDERKKVQTKQKANDKFSEELRTLRSEIGQHENKLRQLGGGETNSRLKDSDINKLATQLEREQANVLKLQAQIEKRRNELMAIDLQYKEETEDMKSELEKLVQDKQKTMDLINLEMQRLNQLKQRKIAALKSIASHTLDSQLTAVLESVGQ